VIVASVCSGIGGAELAFEGHAHAFASETDPFARAVLRARFPHNHSARTVRR
jgi:site-specific DNA-cytosine methylase